MNTNDLIEFLKEIPPELRELPLFHGKDGLYVVDPEIEINEDLLYYYEDDDMQQWRIYPKSSSDKPSKVLFLNL